MYSTNNEYCETIFSRFVMKYSSSNSIRLRCSFEGNSLLWRPVPTHRGLMLPQGLERSKSGMWQETQLPSRLIAIKSDITDIGNIVS